MENKFNHKIEKIAVSSIRQFDAEASAIPGYQIDAGGTRLQYAGAYQRSC